MDLGSRFFGWRRRICQLKRRDLLPRVAHLQQLVDNDVQLPLLRAHGCPSGCVDNPNINLQPPPVERRQEVI